MIKNAAVAKQISDLMLDISSCISHSVASTKNEGPVEEHAAYERAAAKVLSAVQQEVLGPLYAEHPALRPADWSSTRVFPVGESRSLGGIIQPV